MRTHPWDQQQAERMRHGATEMRTLRPGQVLIVTTNDVPGYQVEKVLGDVFGLIVLARGALGNLGASLRTTTGGEVGGYTKLLIDSRNQARDRLRHEAQQRGANAVLAMRFDCNAIGDIMTEVAAYGTAARIARVDRRGHPSTQVSESPEGGKLSDG